MAGSEPRVKAILLVGHMDVVPVEPGTEDEWQEEPFGGRISDGCTWGRGAIDNKSTVVGSLEAVEMLHIEVPRAVERFAFGMHRVERSMKRVQPCRLARTIRDGAPDNRECR